MKKPTSGKTGKTDKTGTREWRPHSVNCCIGCAYDCIYCYAADMAARFKRRNRTDWACHERNRRMAKTPGPWPHFPGGVMFPTAHDFGGENLADCLDTLDGLLAAGNEILIVSKASLETVKWFGRRLQPCGEWRYGDTPKPEIRVTIGGIDPYVVGFWEPNAPTPSERVEALAHARAMGWPTSVSAEPLLEPGRVGDLVDAVAPYCYADSTGRGGTIWIGKARFLRRRTAWVRKAWADDPDRLARLEEELAMLEVGQIDEAVRGVAQHLEFHPHAAMIRYKDSYREVLDKDQQTPNPKEKCGER